MNLLLVDDDADVLEMLSHVLKQPHIDIVTAASGSEALELAARTDFDMIIADFDMPGMDGLHLFDQLAAIKPTVRFVLLTGHALMGIGARDLMTRGLTAVLPKPIDIETLARIVRGET